MSKPFGVSILLPCYNRDCSQQVVCFARLAARQSELGVPVEVVVMEDGSERADAIVANDNACSAPFCRHVVRRENLGLATTRNQLLDEASYRWALLVDCDLMPAAGDFLDCYVSYLREHPEAVAVFGGLLNVRPSFACLRYEYELATANRHTLEARRKNPYQSISCANLLLRTDLVPMARFDQRIRQYGYEDVMFVRQLRLRGLAMQHIENPVLITDFESNEQYIRKTEEAMRTLYAFRGELADDVLLLKGVQRLLRLTPLRLLALVSRVLLPVLRRNLVGTHPCWRLFNPYKACYYILLLRRGV